MGRKIEYDDRMKEVMFLHNKGWSIREISKKLDIPKTTVHVMIHRNDDA